jgi:ribosomal protein L34
MNRLGRLAVVIFAVMLLLSVCSAQQGAGGQNAVPLGDVARKARVKASKTPAKVITNDDLAGTGPDFANGAARTAAAGDASAGADVPAKADAASPAKEPSQAPASTDMGADDVRKRDDGFRARYLELKGNLVLVERELKVAQREYEVQSAEFYADAGRQLRDSKAWAERQKKHEDEIAAKQKQVDKAKEELEKLTDEGRKAGVAPRTFED